MRVGVPNPIRSRQISAVAADGAGLVALPIVGSIASQRHFVLLSFALLLLFGADQIEQSE
jgi:hypothetical protein